MWQIPLLKLSHLPPVLRYYLSVSSHPSFICQGEISSSGSCLEVDTMRISSLPLGSLVTSTVAAVATTTNLFVSSYAGTISTLLLSPETIGGYSLTTTAVNTVAATNPSFLTRDELNGIVYSVDEGFSGPNGSVSSYSSSKSGKLTLLGRTVTLGGPVSSVVYNGGKGLALAH